MSAGRAVNVYAENLYFGPESPGSYAAGVTVAQAWEGSPDHYPNMVQPVFDTANYGTELYIASGPVTIDETESDGELLNPESGTEWVQVTEKRGHTDRHLGPGS